MLGAMASLPVRDGAGVPGKLDPLQDALLDRFGIEVPVAPWPAPPRRLIRVSCQLYNAIADYERLASALVELRAGVPA
jgi:isopenicillin-N epimerase